MKTFLWMLLAIILVSITSCQKKIDIEKENAAIIAVIEQETNTSKAIGFDNWDSLFETWDSYFVQDESLVIQGGGKNGYQCILGWQDVTELRDSQIDLAVPPQPIDYRIEFQNYQIDVYPECAWVYYNEDHISSEGELLRHYDCVRFLNKIDGEWKINFSSYFNATSYEEVSSEASETEEPETEETE